MTLNEILERVFDRGFKHGVSGGQSNDGESKVVWWAKGKILSLLPSANEICDVIEPITNTCNTFDAAEAVFNYINERIEKEMGNDNS
jgi:hypothetical protein